MKKIAAALFLSAIAAPAFSADEGFYAGITVGRSTTDSNIGAIALTKTHDTVYGVLAGYQFNKNFAVEAQYTGAGNFEAAPTTGKNDALGLTAVGILPVADAFSLYAKLGYATTHTTMSANAAPASGTNRSTATYGVGAQYNVIPAVALRLGWDQYGSAINNAGTQNFNASTWTVGAIYKF